MNKFPRVGIGVIIMQHEKVLMGQRIGSHGAKTWSFPGGHLEFGESLESCAKREVKEETGMDISDIALGAFTNDIFEKEDKHYITLYLIAKNHFGRFKVAEKPQTGKLVLEKNFFPKTKFQNPHQ